MISIIIPAKNEALGLQSLLPKLKAKFPNDEIIVVNDGSTDNTVEICTSAGVRLINHPYCKGNGASIKTGANAAKGETLVFMDGDGQHSVENIEQTLKKYNEGYHMVVGARSFRSQASVGRWMANSIYNKLASWMVGQRVGDLTSGLRAVNRNKFKEFLYLLPNGFSYPTTITMSFFRAGYSVGYTPISVGARLHKGGSHIKPIKDGLRFLLIIFKIGTLYSPLKIFFPLSLFHFFCGCSLYMYTYIYFGRFTNMSALLFTTSVLIFLIGLISEQITALIYRPTK